MKKRSTVALYVGGFLGPFGGGVTTSMLPEIGDDFAVTAQSASATLTAYLLPFAVLLLFSGTLGARWGQLRTVRIAYVVYVVASLAAVAAPTFEMLLAARAVQGSANAFTSPLLLAALAAHTDPARLGRVLGIFGALQAAGSTTAPLVGGVAAEVNWRWAFVVIAVVAAGLGLAGLPGSSGSSRDRAPRLRDALQPAVLRLGLVALLGWGALGGLSFLVAYRTHDAFGLEPTARGLVLTLFGLAGIVAAATVGRAIDDVGPRRAVIVGAWCGGALIALVGTVGEIWVLAAAWALAGVAGQAVLVGVNTAVLGSGGANRGGAVSVVQSLRFTGQALAPALLTPLYAAAPWSAFVVPAAMLAIAAPLLLWRSD